VILCLASLGLLTSGCAGGMTQWLDNGFKVGPNYARPGADVADAWIESGDRKLIGEAPNLNAWWTVFNDPVLDNLVQMAYQQNLPLRIAALRVMEARAQYGIARGNIFPQQQEFFGDYVHSKISRNTATALPGGPRSFDFLDVGFDAAWELDIWGRFRRSIESAEASLDANIEGYDDILVTLIGDVAATYVQIRAIEKQLEYTRQNVDIQKGSLQLAEVRFRNGATTELDVQQAKTNLYNTRSLVPALEASIRQAENRLCILLGIPPQDIDNLLDGVQPIPTAPAEVAVGIPADLLRQRPDVREAERQVAAQSAQIGVAYSDLFPAFTITGSIQLESSTLSNLFTGGSLAGSLGAPNVRWNILNYGRIRNNIRVQDARFQQAVVNYQDTVLRANQEVEDSLVGFFKTQQRYVEDKAAVDAARRSVELALTQYRDGAVDFNRVFTLQSILATQENQLAATQGEIAVNLIGIYKALGGGWQIRMGGPTGPLPAFEEIPQPALDEPMPPQPMPDAAAPAAGDMTRFGNPVTRGGRETMPVAWWQSANPPRPLPTVGR
jgi:NodT family efflux transporter outer membrane factor (OMF) lipoprotein